MLGIHWRAAAAPLLALARRCRRSCLKSTALRALTRAHSADTAEATRSPSQTTLLPCRSHSLHSHPDASVHGNRRVRHVDGADTGVVIYPDPVVSNRDTARLHHRAVPIKRAIRGKRNQGASDPKLAPGTRRIRAELNDEHAAARKPPDSVLSAREAMLAWGGAGLPWLSGNNQAACSPEDDRRSYRLAMAVPALIGCSVIASASAVICFDMGGVLTRYATWRFSRIRTLGSRPDPESETAYVHLTKRYMRWSVWSSFPSACSAWSPRCLLDEGRAWSSGVVGVYWPGTRRPRGEGLDVLCGR
jgi:hypothetical protein